MVGALNVGSIKLNFYDQIKTNLRLKDDYKVSEYLVDRKTFGPGEQLGYFELGSTIVLIFEGPKNLDLSPLVMKKVRFGQKLIL